jgi:signal transduction histidine kinase/ActR/RegA family two-component response regulator
VKRSYITLKVIAGLLLLMSAIAFSLYLINTQLKEHSGLVNKINDPNVFIQTWDRVLFKLDDAGETINKYSTTGDSTAFVEFDADRKSIYVIIDSLSLLANANPGRKTFVDSLYSLIDKRLELYVIRAYSVDENTNMAAFDEATKKVVDNENRGIDRDVKSVADDPSKLNAINTGKQTFWKRLFTKRKRNKDSNSGEMTIFVPDTISKKEEAKRVNRIINNLRQAELTVKEENLKKMLGLIAQEQYTDGRLYSLTRQMEQAEIHVTEQQILTTSGTLNDSTRDIMINLGAAGIVFLLLFAFFIQRDVNRNYKLQKELNLARINAEQLAKAREDFASNMSHEIRTPLNALVGFSEQLANSRLDQQQSTMANALLRSSKHLMSVINPVLDYSKLIAGKAELEKTPFSINDVLEDVKLLYEKQVEEKYLKLFFERDSNIPDKVIGDVVKLRQVLYNLVSNAIKFTQRGSIIVSAKLISNADNKATIEFAVSDTGIGIPEDKLTSVFEEFTQADNSITRKYGGTGLGLNIAKRLVELQGGTIEVLSTVDVGSSFVVTLAYSIDTTMGKPSQQTVNTNGAIFKGANIIVCDDEEINRMLANHILSSHGAKVYEASSAIEMIKLVEEIVPDLVLTDLHMPGIDGIEALLQIRNNTKRNIAEVPIIALTGNVKQGEKERCLEMGMNGFLAKPYLEAQLIDIVSSVLNRN